MMAHPNVVDVIPSLYGVFAVFAFQWTNVGTEKVAIRSSTVTALLRLVLHTSREMNKNKLCSNYYTTVLNTKQNQVYGRGVSIPANADLNDYTSPGNYYSVNTANTATLKNVPGEVTAGFRLEVKSTTGTGVGTYFTQILYPNQKSLMPLFRHCDLDNDWGDWKSPADKVDLFELYSLNGAVAIPEGDDLDDYINPGNYICGSNDIAKTLKNCPYTSGGFAMHNERTTGSTSGYLKQRMVVNSKEPIEYWRILSENKWSGWKLAEPIPLSATKLDLNDGVNVNNKELSYYKVGSVVHLSGNIAITNFTGDLVEVATLPEDCRPLKNTYWFAPLTGINIARCLVNTAGVIKIEWIKQLSDGSNYTGAVSWLNIETSFLI